VRCPTATPVSRRLSESSGCTEWPPWSTSAPLRSRGTARTSGRVHWLSPRPRPSKLRARYTALLEDPAGADWLVASYPQSCSRCDGDDGRRGARPARRVWTVRGSGGSSAERIRRAWLLKSGGEPGPIGENQERCLHPIIGWPSIGLGAGYGHHAHVRAVRSGRDEDGHSGFSPGWQRADIAGHRPRLVLGGSVALEAHRPDRGTRSRPCFSRDARRRYFKDPLDPFGHEVPTVANEALVLNNGTGSDRIRLRRDFNREIHNPGQRCRIAGGAGRSQNQCNHQYQPRPGGGHCSDTSPWLRASHIPLELIDHSAWLIHSSGTF